MNLAVCFEIPFTGLKIITENLCDGVAALECLVVNHECDVSVMKVKTPRGREFLFWKIRHDRQGVECGFGQTLPLESSSLWKTHIPATGGFRQHIVAAQT